VTLHHPFLFIIERKASEVASTSDIFSYNRKGTVWSSTTSNSFTYYREEIVRCSAMA